MMPSSSGLARFDAGEFWGVSSVEEEWGEAFCFIFIDVFYSGYVKTSSSFQKRNERLFINESEFEVGVCYEGCWKPFCLWHAEVCHPEYVVVFVSFSQIHGNLVIGSEIDDSSSLLYVGGCHEEVVDWVINIVCV